MAWKTMGALRACDLIDFWIAAPWPLTRPEVQTLAGELGWTVDEKGTLTNPIDDLSMPAVITTVMPNGEFGTLRFRVTDVVRDENPDGLAFLNDEFTPAVREGASRWGEPRLGSGRTKTAQWDLPGGGRVTAKCSSTSVALEFATPQQAAQYRRRGE